jgi:hypothetical protein
MLEDIYIIRKHNKHGEPYGFVRFSNVRDIIKLTKALNAVSFGHYRVWACVARFDRTDKAYDRTDRGGVKQEEAGLARDEGVSKGRLDGDVADKVPKLKTQSDADVLAPPETGGSSLMEGVRVGEVLVRLGEHREKADDADTQKQGDLSKVHADVAK